MRLVIIPLFFAATLIGCGNGANEKSASADTSAQESAEEIDTHENAAPAADPTATISGVIKFEGDAPRRRPVQMGSEPHCQDKQAGKLLDESVIVNGDGTLRNVFVWIKKGVRGKFPIPDETVYINQKNCQYVPHVAGARVGQRVVVRNDDPVLHNVRMISKKRQQDNYAQARQGMENEHHFKRQEVMLEMKCDVHGWMGSYIGLVKHPFFAVTADGGTFSLGKLPRGDYVVEAWHEVFGRKEQTVTVGDGETKTVEFSFAE